VKQLPVRAIISSLLLLLFLFLAFSGALLHVGKTGLVLGIARHALRDAHAIAALLTCVLIPIHVFFNRRLYLKALRTLQAPKAEGAKTGEQN